ncbi:cytochrome b5 domain-containing protein [Candidatus Woesearchaeota archaeon]|nr:MAG: cytochrome b5 domain-containing protein [Candidatus Woesearchaeota archaeon]
MGVKYSYFVVVLFVASIVLAGCGTSVEKSVEKSVQQDVQSSVESAKAADEPTPAGSQQENADDTGETPEEEIAAKLEGVEEETAQLEEQVPVPEPSELDTQVAGQVPEQASGITLAEVAAHDNAQSCWTAINGKVYDLTDWISQHPGGAGNILKLCGIDGSSAFMGKHGGNAKAKSTLENYEIGVLSS